jgi:hypothetical protein
MKCRLPVVPEDEQDHQRQAPGGGAGERFLDSSPTSGLHDALPNATSRSIEM